MFVCKRNPGRSGIVVFLTGIAWCCLAAVAFAHASLTETNPADGAVVARPPAIFTLSFSEPVSPLVLKLVRPDGKALPLDRFVLRDRTLEITPPDNLGTGTYVLTWRVVSEDGHPVGGSTIFSIGSPSAAPPDLGAEIDWPVRTALLLTRVATYAGLFFGIGGFFARQWLIPGRGAVSTIILLATSIGLVSVVLSLGLQGIDALGAPRSSIFDPSVWRAGLSTSFGITAIVLSGAFCVALAGGFSQGGAIARPAALLGLVAGSASLALSGHASAAQPQWLMRPAVFLHAAAIASWVGALLPLAGALRRDQGAARLALSRFARLIPAAVLLLVVAGTALAVVQVETPAALFTTAYGNVLLVKLALLALLFALVAVNRWLLTKPAEGGDAKATRRLMRAVVIESVVVLAIFAVAASWRFTPPPRALAAAAVSSVSTHIHSDKAMAEVTISPARAGAVEVSAFILTPDFAPLTPKDVTFVFSNPAAGVEPMRKKAAVADDGAWHADIVLPLAGKWEMRIDVLVTDFELVRLSGGVEIGK